MTVLQNIWADLVEKRLWPVALALLVALIALPSVLGGKSSDSAGTTPLAGVTPPAQNAANQTVALDTSVQATARRNRGGRRRNPFQQQYLPKLDATGAGLITPGTGAPPTTSPAAALGNGSGSGSGSGSGTGTPAPTTPSSTPTSGSKPAPSTSASSVYKVNLRFGQAGSIRTIKDIARLTPLPSANDPFFVFLGVKDDGRTVVFMLSSDAKANGDGACRPTSSDCETIEMRAGDTEFFDLTTDGGVQQYQLDVLSVGRSTASSAKVARAAHRRMSAIGLGMLQEARSANDLPAQLSWYAWDAGYGVLVPNTADALSQ